MIMGINNRVVSLGLRSFYLIRGKLVFRLNDLETSNLAKAIYVLINLFSLLAFALIFKNVNYAYSIPIAVASILGRYIDTRFFRKLSDKVLNALIFVMVFIIGLIMLIRP